MLFLGVCEGLSRKGWHLNWGTGEHKWPSPVWAGSIQSSESLKRTKTWKKVVFALCPKHSFPDLSASFSSLQTWTGVYATGSLLSGLQTTHRRLSWVSSLQRADDGTPSHHCASQCWIIHFFLEREIYISPWLCFSGEPRLING